MYSTGEHKARITPLPDFSLESQKGSSGQFVALGIESYRAAADYVWRLPYGRNSDRSDYRLVLKENRGTCSTKHALLANLAQEHEHPVELLLGIYGMNEHNTPGVGSVLRKYGLDFVPEAHCYLSYLGERVDLTCNRRHYKRRCRYQISECIYHGRIISTKIASLRQEGV